MFTFLIRGVCVFALAAGLTVWVPQTNAAETEKGGLSFTGKITGMDRTAKTVTVKQLLDSRTFNLTEDFKVYELDVASNETREAKLGDLKIGQQVRVEYDEINGARLARSIQEMGNTFSGRITEIDPNTKTVKVNKLLDTRTFNLADKSNILVYEAASPELKGMKLDDLNVGLNVTVGYEVVNGAFIAHRIEEQTRTFSGQVSAVDPNLRTVTVKKVLETRTFDVPEGAEIVMRGEEEATLGELLVGHRVAVEYREANGVLTAIEIESTSEQTAKVD